MINAFSVSLNKRAVHFWNQKIKCTHRTGSGVILTKVADRQITLICDLTNTEGKLWQKQNKSSVFAIATRSEILDAVENIQVNLKKQQKKKHT